MSQIGMRERLGFVLEEQLAGRTAGCRPPWPVAAAASAGRPSARRRLHPGVPGACAAVVGLQPTGLSRGARRTPLFAQQNAEPGERDGDPAASLDLRFQTRQGPDGLARVAQARFAQDGRGTGQCRPPFAPGCPVRGRARSASTPPTPNKCRNRRTPSARIPILRPIISPVSPSTLHRIERARSASRRSNERANPSSASRCSLVALTAPFAPRIRRPPPQFAKAILYPWRHFVNPA
jgi:hypothetical protein